MAPHQNGAVDVDLVDRPKVKKEEKPKIVKPLVDTVNNTSVNSNPPSEINREKKIPVNENSSIDVKEEEASFLTKFIIIVILGFLVLDVGSFLVNIFSTVTEHNVSVVQKTWQRSVDIEEYRAISDTDWCSSMPSGAYSVSSFREIRSHRQVADGQTCSTVRSDRGDGSYRKERICETKYRSEPVYDKRCNYKINKWKFRNSELSSGGGTSLPKDPNLSHLNLNNSNTLGNIRLGGRSSQYVVSFEYKDEKKDVRKKCSYSQGGWNDFKLNETYKGNVRPFFGLMCNNIGSLMSKK